MTNSAASVDVGVAPPARVVLALGRANCPRACLVRVNELARALGAVVHVVRVLPRWPRPRRWLPKRLVQWLDERERGRVRALLRATRYWLAGAYGVEPPLGHVVVRSGNFVKEAALHARAHQPALIVVPPDLSRIGAIATRLALATGQRVLIPRPAARSTLILAASDLCTPGFPVLEEGARLGAELHRGLVSFHNVDPLSAMAESESGAAVSNKSPDRTNPGLRLREAIKSFATPTTSALRSQIDPVAAILGEASALQADVVVVGVHRRSRWERLIHGSVAAQVVRRARCSVVVAPVAAASTSGAPS